MCICLVPRTHRNEVLQLVSTMLRSICWRYSRSVVAGAQSFKTLTKFDNKHGNPRADKNTYFARPFIFKFWASGTPSLWALWQLRNVKYPAADKYEAHPRALYVRGVGQGKENNVIYNTHVKKWCIRGYNQWMLLKSVFDTWNSVATIAKYFSSKKGLHRDLGRLLSMNEAEKLTWKKASATAAHLWPFFLELWVQS